MLSMKSFVNKDKIKKSFNQFHLYIVRQWRHFSYKTETIIITGLLLLISTILVLRNGLSQNNKAIITPSQKTIVNENSYHNKDFGFHFDFSPSTKVFSEEKSTSTLSNRLLALVLKDNSLVVGQLKDDVFYFALEIWKSESTYAKNICYPDKKAKKKVETITLAGKSVSQYTYTDKNSRYHLDTCLEKDGKSYLLMASVSTKHNNLANVKKLLDIIIKSFQFN